MERGVDVTGPIDRVLEEKAEVGGVLAGVEIGGDEAG